MKKLVIEYRWAIALAAAAALVMYLDYEFGRQWCYVDLTFGQ